MTSAWNNAQKLTSLTSSLAGTGQPPDLFTNATYNAPGLVVGDTPGNGEPETYIYGNRLWMTSFRSPPYTWILGYAPDGSVTSASDTVNGNWTYTYDNLNRVSAANGGTNSDYTYAYDRYGNRWQQNGTHSMSLSFSGNNNRADGYTYDAAGNLQVDNQLCSYTYDAEDRITAVTGGTCSAATYGYDVFGRRISKATGGVTTYYLYDRENRPFVEASSATAWTRMELYAGTRHVGTYTGTTGPAYFDYADWLGTERVRTPSSGAIYETCTSLPFGDGQTCTGSDVSPMHFTGKERDSESGLDNFGKRYNTSGMGRFMSPDPLLSSGHPSNPQTWNRYAYTVNDPLNIVDPTGLYNLVNNCDPNDKKCNKQFKQDEQDLKNGLSDLQKNVDKMEDGPEKDRLMASLKALGTENDGNNVNVKFAAVGGSGAAQTDPVADTAGSKIISFNVTFDPSKISGGTNSWGIDAAHEGTHISDFGDPNATALTTFQVEYRGYQTSVWAAQALGLDSLRVGGAQIWSNSWGAADRQTLMDRGITQLVTSIPGDPEPQPPIPHNPWPN
jgi:RHS repeat-associated protein